jgi:ribosomal-protein-alanine N-acetyltransferase
LGEHLPYKEGVTGSSPVPPIEIVETEQWRTERLLARRPQPSDIDGYLALLLDPEVEVRLRAAGAPLLDEESVAVRLAGDELHWERHGFGPWALFEIDGGAFVGRGGLQWTRLEEREAVELPWAIVSQHWGRGFATEAAEAALGWARERELQEVIALITPDNDASRRVAEKVDLRQEGQTVHAGLPHLVYRARLTRALSA